MFKMRAEIKWELRKSRQKLWRIEKRQNATLHHKQLRFVSLVRTFLCHVSNLHFPVSLVLFSFRFLFGLDNAANS
ncbi:hypothetical protein DL95DRAFT_8522 [Leptodontidium sp. 2 PMI_412]|nr:hypothetical protein DL95DRAFT_8522 [Leptodontidium sp. 2 PMI_412]